ncbi:mannose-1-phosphate guanylyltransferase/mannose-6-phosphate isomerase, partial [Psychrobacter immobilis]
GYIECQTVNIKSNYHKVARFVEKPNLQLAQQYIEQDSFYWNSGVFIVKNQFWLTAIEKFDSDIFEGVTSAWHNKKIDIPFIRPDAKQFEKTPSNSIDYAVIEPCARTEYKLGMFELATEWSDLGTWQAVNDYQKTNNADADGNVWLGDVLGVDTSNCYVHAEQRLVSLLGVEDLIVVDTDDALLIAHKSHSQDVKKIVSKLNEDKRVEANTHRRVYRPWGWYQSIDECERFKVKRICVQPKASLSLQKHHHRAEHWVVVKGTAQIVCDDKTMLLSENQSTYIPLGAVHRLSNPGNIPLEMIEVQSGSYLEEDDIVRLEDSYGRG